MACYTAALLLCLALSATQVQSQETRSWLANGRGYNVVPENVNTTSMISSVTFTTNNQTMTLKGSANFTNAANLTTATLRYGSVNETGPVVFTIYPANTTGEAPAETPSEKDFTVDFSATADDLETSEQVPDFEAFLEALGTGMIYYNVETTDYPEGENRGQFRLVSNDGTGEKTGGETTVGPTDTMPEQMKKKMMRKLLAA